MGNSPEEFYELELYIDGGSRGNPGPAACAYILRTPDGKIIKSEGIYLGESTNNIAEYSGLLRGLESARDLNVRELNIFSDSELLVKQLIGEYRIRNIELQRLLEQIQRLLLLFDRWQIRHISREKNKEADRLVNVTLNREQTKPPKTSLETEETRNKVTEEVRVLVEVVKPPNQAVCQANLQKGMCFVFTKLTPPGFCTYALQSILPEIFKLQQSNTDQVKVKCWKPGCNAEFRLKKI